ncbi:MAG: Fe-S cluster assembly protein SufD [Hyphomicrobiales bacterium]|nr:Fe-S cluster assembly protein SufD [Hyphomicrobiales bacterium]
MNIQPAKLDAVTAAPAPTGVAAALIAIHAEAKLPGDDVAWVRAMREAGLAVIAKRGLPNRRVEEWKYTDLRAAMTEAYLQSLTPVPVSRADIERALGDLAALPGRQIVFVNGAHAPGLSRDADTLGVELVILKQAMADAPSWLIAAFSASNASEGEAVNALNAAFMTDGAAIRISENARLTEPLHIVHVAAGSDAVASAMRSAIIVQSGAEAMVLESFISFGDAKAQTTSVTHVLAAEGAKLTHVKYSGENRETQHLTNWDVKLGAKADYLAIQFAIGAKLSRHQLFLRYEGEGAKAHFLGAQLLRGRQHCDMTMVIDHAVPGCESREHVKAVLDDNARGIFQAKVLVRPDAQQTDGRQMAQALMLSDDAEFDSKPELEIYADDVKCNHGSTVGELDEDMLFYFLSRGIGEKEAKALLIQAFIGEVLDKIEDETLRNAFTAKTEAWLAA